MRKLARDSKDPERPLVARGISSRGVALLTGQGPRAHLRTSNDPDGQGEARAGNDLRRETQEGGNKRNSEERQHE